MAKKRTKTKKNKKEFDITVHYSIEGRKRFKRKMILRFLLLIIFLCGCAAMVVAGGWKWDPNSESGFDPKTYPTQPWQYALIWIGAILAILAIAGYIFWTIKTWKVFYDTQKEYFKTKDFKDKKEKALKSDISKLSKSTIKWYKKLGYLTGPQKNDWISKFKDYKRNNK